MRDRLAASDAALLATIVGFCLAATLLLRDRITGVGHAVDQRPQSDVHWHRVRALPWRSILANGEPGSLVGARFGVPRLTCIATTSFPDDPPSAARARVAS